MGCCKVMLNSMALSLFIVTNSQLLWVCCNIDGLQPSFSVAASTASIKGSDSVLAMAAQPHCRETQRSAMLEFYKDFMDGPYTWIYDTANISDCCDWNGVSCNPSGLVVSLSIDIRENAFVGINDEASTLASAPPWPIPLTKLHALRNLELSGFNLAPPFPSEIGRLSQTLSSLSIELSNLEAVLLPWAALSNLSSLTHLTLSRDIYLQNEEPPAPHDGSLLSGELCNLTRLQLLDLRHMGLGGSILSCLSSLSGLSYLDLSLNHLSGLIRQCWNASSSLSHLDLRKNELKVIGECFHPSTNPAGNAFHGADCI